MTLHASIPFSSIPFDDSCNRLRVLPGASLGAVAGEGVEAQASLVEVNALEANEDLVRVVLSRAGDESTVGVGEDAEAVAGADGPASLNGAFGHSGGMGLGVLDGTGVGVDVDLLATRHNDAHGKSVLAASESSGVAGGAAANVLDVLGAVGGGLLVKPDGVARSRDGLVVDGRSGAGRGEAEVLSRGSGKEAGEGSDGEGGLHFEWWFGFGVVWRGCVGWNWSCWSVLMCVGLNEEVSRRIEGLDILIPSCTWLLLFTHPLGCMRKGRPRIQDPV